MLKRCASRNYYCSMLMGCCVQTSLVRYGYVSLDLVFSIVCSVVMITVPISISKVIEPLQTVLSSQLILVQSFKQV